MDLDVKKYIPEDFSDDSRVWIYQANRLLNINETLEANRILEDFVSSWNTHGAQVKGFGKILFGQFVVLIADESQQFVSGCSTDSSVRIVKELENLFKVNFFDRQSLAFYVKNKIECVRLSHVDYALKNNILTPDTHYFNNTVLTKKALLTKWIIPIKESWLAQKLKIEI